MAEITRRSQEDLKTLISILQETGEIFVVDDPVEEEEVEELEVEEEAHVEEFDAEEESEAGGPDES